MNKIKQVLVIILLTITGTFAQDPVLKKSAVVASNSPYPYPSSATTNYAQIFISKTDKDDYKYLSGRYKGTVDFDPGSGIVNYTSTNTGAPAGFDLFIAKLDKNDNLIWVKTIGAMGDNEQVLNLAVDANQNVIIAGHFRVDMDFDPGAGTFTMSNGSVASDFKSLFMLKLDASGNFVWAKNFQANTTSMAFNVSDMYADAQNNIQLLGSFSGTADFDPNVGSVVVSSSSSDFDAFFLKLTASGNYVFHKKYGGTFFLDNINYSISTSSGRGSVTDANGDIYFLWSFKNNSFGTPRGYTMVTKYSATGTQLWEYNTYGTYLNTPNYLRIVADKIGNIFIAADNQVVKINASTGSEVWTKLLRGSSILIDKNNNIIRTGAFDSPFGFQYDFDPSTAGVYLLGAIGTQDISILKTDNNGYFLYAKALGAVGSYCINSGVSINANGELRVQGQFSTTIDVDPSVGTKILTNTSGNQYQPFWATYSDVPCTGAANSSSSSVTACNSYRWPTKAVIYNTSGIYRDTLTNIVGCDSIITLNLTVNPLPTITTSNNNGTNLTCANPNTTVTASGASTYAWTGTGGFTATTAAATITAAGTYIVTGTSTTGCTATASVVITEDKTPPPNITFNYSRTTINCTNPTANINAFSSGSTFSWTGPSGFTASTSSATVSTGGIYTVTATGTNGCTATANSQNIISDKTPPIVSITPISAVLTCTNPSASFTASGANTYSWSGPATANSGVTITGLINAGTYTVVGTNSTNGCAASASVTVTSDKVVPTVSISPTSALLTCTNPSAILTAGGNGVSFVWSRAAGGYTANTPTATVTSAGDYRVTATGANGCTAISGFANITANITPPSFTLSPADPVNLTCTNPSISVSAPPGSLTGVTFAWTGPLGFTSTSSFISPNVIGTYTIIATGTNGCTTTLSRTVNSINKTPPTITVTPSSAALTCTNPSVSLTASGVSANTTGWSGPGGYSNSGATVNINTAGTYIVSGMSSTNGCTATTSVVITDNKTPPVITITPSSAVLTCANSSQNLTASGAVSYVWTRSGGGFNATTPSITVTTPDTYFATGTGANGCTSLGSINVTQNIAAPSAGLTYPTTVLTCTNPSIPLTASGGDSYAWTGTGGFTATTATANISTIGTYVVTITGSNGCTATRSVVITENKTLPTVAIVPSNPSFTCTVSTINLANSGNGVTYNWSKVGDPFTASGVSNINVTTTGTYVLTVSALNGCTATATTEVIDNKTPPVIVINPSSTLVNCANPSATLAASGGNTYIWSKQFVGNVGTTASITITSGGLYTVLATGANGCTTTESVLITQNFTPPNASITPTNPTLTCASPSLTLTVSGGNTYAWTGTGGFTASTATANISTAGTYIVTATGTNGCTASISVVVGENKTSPTISINPANPVLTCTNLSTNLTASGANTYSWTGTGGFTASTAVATISAIGTYVVTATGANGCTASASIVVTENKALPTITINPTSVALACTNPSPTISASSTGSTFLWTSSNGGFTSTSSSINVTTAGTYTVTSGGGNSGCTASASVIVTGSNTIPPPMTITANPANAVITCTNQFITLNSSVMNTYAWVDTGGFLSSNSSISPSVAGTYTLTGTTTNGCTATASITLTEDKVIPTVAITPTNTVLSCTNPTLILTASGSGNSTYSWRGDPFIGAIVNPTLTITTAGSFSLQATADNGCKSSLILFTITDNKTPPPVIISSNIASNVLNCLSPSRTLTASGGSTYAWTGTGGFTATTAAVTVSTAGTYTVTATGTNGCSATTSITLTDNTAPPTVTVTPTSAVLTCTNLSTSLTASGGSSYSWTGTGGFMANTAAATVSVAGTYTVTVTGSNGCTATASVLISGSNAVPTVSITPATSVLDCNNLSITLTASGASTYAWTGTGGFSANTASATITAAGTYTVTGTGANGCTATLSRIITDNTTPPTLVVTPTSTVLNCANPNLTLTASGGATYKWYFSGILISSGASINVSSPATYLVTTTGANGCTNFKNVVVTENVVPPTVSVTPTSVILTCANPSTTLIASGASTYAWTGTGGFTATTTSVTITAVGTYIVTGTGANGCTASASVVITENRVTPILVITNPATSAIVNLTLPTVTAGSTLPVGTTLSYFEDNAASISVPNPMIITAAGTYYIKATVAGTLCTDIKPVIVTISTGNCAENVALTSLTDNYTTGIFVKEAKNISGTITATNKITGTANVTYRAGKSIMLNPGFKADNGVVFRTEFGGCN